MFWAGPSTPPVAGCSGSFMANTESATLGALVSWLVLSTERRVGAWSLTKGPAATCVGAASWALAVLAALAAGSFWASSWARNWGLCLASS